MGEIDEGDQLGIVRICMGMFDSLIIEINGVQVELQSKQFEQTLGRYCQGDLIAGASQGVSIYFDICRLNANQRQVYSEGEGTTVHTIFIVLVEALFVDYVVVTGELEPVVIRSRIAELKEKWTDSARLIARLREFHVKQRSQLAGLKQRVNRVQGVIADYRLLQSGQLAESWSQIGLFGHDVVQLKQGVDPIALIESILNNNGGLSTGDDEYDGQEPAVRLRDPLENYRL